MSRAFADSTLVRVVGPDAFEPALRQFMKACRETGIFSELKRRESYEPPSLARRRKAQRARVRRLKAARRRRENGRSDDWKPTPTPRA